MEESHLLKLEAQVEVLVQLGEMQQVHNLKQKVVMGVLEFHLL